MAADATAAVGAKILEELVSEVDVAGGADRGGESRWIGKRQAVGQLPQALELRGFQPILGEHIDRCSGGNM
jgi:hypothetical protein